MIEKRKKEFEKGQGQKGRAEKWIGVNVQDKHHTGMRIVKSSGMYENVRIRIATLLLSSSCDMILVRTAVCYPTAPGQGSLNIL